MAKKAKPSTPASVSEQTTTGVQDGTPQPVTLEDMTVEQLQQIHDMTQKKAQGLLELAGRYQFDMRAKQRDLDQANVQLETTIKQLEYVISLQKNKVAKAAITAPTAPPSN